MFSVIQAKKILFENVRKQSEKIKSVSEVSGYVSAKNIKSPVDLPLFDQSAMDGFAVNFEPEKLLKGKNFFKICGEIKAGDKPYGRLKKNNAVYIYTGAEVPVNTACVVMQEKTVVENGKVVIHKEALIKGSNIRSKGSQIKKGELALKKGFLMNPGAIGFLSSMGISKIKVTGKPSVSVLSTGNELQRSGLRSSPGKIYDSNSIMLKAVINDNGFEAKQVNSVRDDRKKLSKYISGMLSASDVLIITGGISVGKYDLVKEILESCGVKELFYKVSQKPGKPMYAGKLKEKIIFALPGNPAASLVCFYEYILPALRKMSCYSDYDLKKEHIPLSESYEVKGNRDLFLKAKISDGKVT
ncbi:MAG TPA: molybdopterin molybdotransferase MoeA, partial [Ignavibacteria bacterium]|nr:molybdopterin molybdotransferase MoeA [Ignavibacteria bacterium]HMR40787.1 molybdopterin molybdotransferase MoeA [Ignavibacteria bacterium]